MTATLCTSSSLPLSLSIFHSLRLSKLTLGWSRREQPPRLVAAHLTFKVLLPFSPREHESLKTLPERTSDGSPLTISLGFIFYFFGKCAAAELNVEKENMCRKTCAAVTHTHAHTHMRTRHLYKHRKHTPMHKYIFTSDTHLLITS